MVTKPLRPQPGQVAVSYQFSALSAAKPNLMRYEMWEVKSPKGLTSKHPAPADFAIVSNGKKQWTQVHRNYSIAENPDPQEFQTIMEPWDGFYSSDHTLYEQVQDHKKRKDDLRVRRLPAQKVDGVLCDRVEVDVEEEHADKVTKTRIIVFLRPDGLVRRQITTTTKGTVVFIVSSDLYRIEKNPDLSRQLFAYTPPKGSTLFQAAKGGPEATSHETLLSNGTPAPDFVARDKNGKPIHLSDLKGKVVVLDFWASWCMPCVASMPHTQSVVAKLQKEGRPVVVLALDDSEKVEAFTAWVAKNGSKYPSLNFAYSPEGAKVSHSLFKVTAIPTQYIIDPSGTIRATLVGFSGESDTLERVIRAALNRS